MTIKSNPMDERRFWEKFALSSNGARLHLVQFSGYRAIFSRTLSHAITYTNGELA